MMIMPLLAYCLAPVVEISGIPCGAFEAQVESFDFDGLRCYFSRHSEFPTSPDALPSAALGYHHVVQHIFAAITVIPFRFPTLSPSVDDLRQKLEDRLRDYGSALERLAGKVQMEINIRTQPEPQAGASGAEYLRGRQEANQQAQRVVQEARQAVQDLAQNWREREVPNGVQCFALLPGGAENEFLARLSALQLPSRVECRIVGPWPPSEFIDM